MSGRKNRVLEKSASPLVLVVIAIFVLSFLALKHYISTRSGFAEESSRVVELLAGQKFAIQCDAPSKTGVFSDRNERVVVIDSPLSLQEGAMRLEAAFLEAGMTVTGMGTDTLRARSEELKIEATELVGSKYANKDSLNRVCNEPEVYSQLLQQPSDNSIFYLLID